MQTNNWYKTENEESMDSPSLLIFRDREAENTATTIDIAGRTKSLVPRVKTRKMREVVAMKMDAGITQFRCATIAEAEMLAEVGARKFTTSMASRMQLN